MNSLFKTILFFLISYLSIFFTIANAAEKLHMPFMLAKIVNSSNTLSIGKQVEKQLGKGHFEILGHYTPYKGAYIIMVSNANLRRNAGLSKNGVYAAVQRISITTQDNKTQISYTNPTYMAHAYRLRSDLAQVTRQLKNTLGFVKQFGAAKGRSKSELRRYRYKDWIMMPNFTDQHELIEYPDFNTAVKNVLAALKDNDAGARKVYMLKLANQKKAIIGVRMSGSSSYECSNDQYVMQRIDFKNIKSTAHLPYEIIINNGTVNALFAEFRIALNFPDLTMIGKNSFNSIMCTPNAILETLTLASGGDPEESW